MKLDEKYFICPYISKDYFDITPHGMHPIVVSTMGTIAANTGDPHDPPARSIDITGRIPLNPM